MRCVRAGAECVQLTANARATACDPLVEECAPLVKVYDPLAEACGPSVAFVQVAAASVRQTGSTAQVA